MRLWILLLAGILILSVLPEQGTEISKLRPASLLYVYMYEGNVVMETDAGDKGQGSDLTEALQDLKQSAPGVVFLDTTQHLILTEGTLPLLPEVSDILRPTAELCVGKNGLDPEDAEKYLAAHPSGATLLAVQSRDAAVPRLKKEKGRLSLEG